jgi:hypothetical protein
MFFPLRFLVIPSLLQAMICYAPYTSVLAYNPLGLKPEGSMALAFD